MRRRTRLDERRNTMVDTADTRIHLCGITLDNPVIPASGTFGFGREFAKLYDLDTLGSIAFKGTTLDPRDGNPLPRIAETSEGIINSVGLQNPGLEKVVSEELPALAEIFHKPLIANISGFSVEEYVRCAEVMDAQKQVGIIEVNISCPNVHGGGLSFGADPDNAAEVTKAVSAVTQKPVFIKLTPNVTDITDIACACEDAGADGLSLINTVLAMRIDIRKRKPVIANRVGGLSGPAVFPIAVRMVNEVSKAVDIPVIGMGGISSAEDVIEMMMAGASAVQIGAANLVDPWACTEIIEDLPKVMNRLGISRLEEIIGCV